MYKRLAAMEVANRPRDFFVPVLCVCHSMALGTKTGLTLAETWARRFRRRWKYFAALAKLTHCWRELAATIMVKWVEMFGHKAAMLHARKLVPKCIAGRWLSAAATEERSRPRWAKEGGRLGAS
eukprot:4089019-Pyramimonas_sp.AAC.1